MLIDLNDKEIEFLIRVLVNNYAEDDQDFDKEDISDGGICSLLIGNIIKNDNKLKEAYYQARENKFSKTEEIKTRLFMGNGWHSTIEKTKIHKKIDFIAGQLSYIDQNGGMGSKFNEEEDKQANFNIKMAVQDLLIAFDLTPEDLK